MMATDIKYIYNMTIITVTDLLGGVPSRHKSRFLLKKEHYTHLNAVQSYSSTII